MPNVLELPAFDLAGRGLGASGVFKMEYSFPLASILAATAAGLVFGVLAALLPARQAARMEIIKALRYE